MTTLLLARHGETDWNGERRWQGHSDQPLNDTGRSQAAELAASLAGAQVAAIYSSDLARARETAEIVAERLGLPVVVDAGLREVDVGNWSGLTHDEIPQLHPEGFARWQDGGHGWEGGESYDELGVRAVATLLRLAERHHGETVLVVDAGLREVDVGNWSGLTHDEIPQLHPEGFARWQDGEHGWEGGESYDELGVRAVATLLRLAERHHGETVLVVAHGGTIRACRAAAAGVTYRELRETGLPRTGNCSVHELRVAEGRLTAPIG